MTLYEIASLILQFSHQPVGRVRFAKLIYFIHKELVRKKFADLDGITYIRLPLGPVPADFVTLADSPEIILQRIPNAQLSYESEAFFIPNSTPPKGLPRALQNTLERTFAALERYTTAELVAASHDPSWHRHYNGEKYFLIAADLRNTFPLTPLAPISPLIDKILPKQILPKQILPKRSTPNEIGALQAALLRGMLNDIVKESTDLEYPDDEQGNTPQTPPQPPSKSRSRLKPKPDGETPKSS